MKDGTVNKCKSCCKKQAKSLYNKNIKNKDWLKKERARCRERNIRLEYSKKYKATTFKQKARIAVYRKRWLEKNPEKRLAQQKVAKAIRQGVLKKQPCELCGLKKRIHAHHYDYSKPLDVQWLCSKHHRELHRLDSLIL